MCVTHTLGIGCEYGYQESSAFAIRGLASHLQSLCHIKKHFIQHSKIFTDICLLQISKNKQVEQYVREWHYDNQHKEKGTEIKNAKVKWRQITVFKKMTKAAH